MPGKRERQKNTKQKVGGVICTWDVDNSACFKTPMWIMPFKDAKPFVQAVKNIFPFRAG